MEPPVAETGAERPATESADPRPAAIEIQDLHVTLGNVEILHGVNARIHEGEITALIGPNGAGKTTLLLAILGMIPYRGRIVILSRSGRPRIGYVPQHLDFDRGMPVTVMDFLCLPRQRRPVWLSHGRAQKRRVLENLSWVESAHLADRRLGNLSGGELQRVLLAMAMVEDPDIILLDEPASSVDKSGEELFMRLIRRLWQERKITLLMVSHDLSMVTRLANQVICLNREVLSEGKTSEVLNERNLSACFGTDKGLLLHDHPWDTELSCAYDPAAPPPGKK
jgi:zinc transport system ATP-binding protein